MYATAIMLILSGLSETATPAQLAAVKSSIARVFSQARKEKKC